MNRIIFISAIAVIAIAIYIWFGPNRKNPVVTLPQPIEVEPVAEPVAQVPDMSKVKTEDITLGEGTEVVVGSQVSVQYKGMLTDGTEFDSSYSRDSQPLEFTVSAGQMIPGFDYGVRGMKVGGVRKITIPPELGYGNQSTGTIPPNSTLVFEVTLEKVE